MLLLVCGAILISFSPILVKSVNASPEVIAFYRCFNAAWILAIVLIFKKKLKFKIRLHQLKYAIYCSLAFIADLYIWHSSIEKIGAGLSTVLANTQVFYLSFLGILFFNEKQSKLQFFYILLGFLGICFVCYSPTDYVANSEFVSGCLLALVAGLFYSLFTLNLKQFTKNSQGQLSDTQRLFIVCALTSLWGIIFSAKDISQFFQVSRLDFFYLLGLGLFIQVIGWLLIKKNLLNINTATVGLVLLLQPVLACVLSFFIFSEQFSWLQCIGIFATLFSIYQHQKLSLKETPL